MTIHQGQIIRSVAGFHTVLLENGQQVICRLRGRLKHAIRGEDIAAVGDRVMVTCHSAEDGMIEEVLPRTHELVRLAPTPRGIYRQVLLANPDQLALIFACAEPAPHQGMLDRFLVIAEKQGLPVFIVANKTDLVSQAEAEALFGHYPPLGYPVLYTSVRAQRGLEELHAKLAGRLTAFSGPSGVGKSSLLNAIQPGLGLAAREVSHATGKGKHTTTIRQMYPLQGGGFVIDTPGIKALALWDTEPEELDGYFPELRSLVQVCQFNDCTHRHEPGCAIRQGVEQGKIHPERYRSYLRLRYGGETEE